MSTPKDNEEVALKSASKEETSRTKKRQEKGSIRAAKKGGRTMKVHSCFLGYIQPHVRRDEGQSATTSTVILQQYIPYCFECKLGLPAKKEGIDSEVKRIVPRVFVHTCEVFKSQLMQI